MGLGVLGIGLPDIALFVGMILKGIYEVSLHYGYDYDSSYEKYLILKMISAALSKDEEWVKRNEELDDLMYAVSPVNEDILKKEIESTANLLAIDLLVLKFVQGLPIVGAVGGAFNPVYYNK